ncbi:MAG: flavin reductase [Oscillospiraceae bacterium]|nr:flavin reductase [Oscillospiraceae bacterium]
MADAIAATVKVPEPVKEVVSEDVDKKVLNNISYGLYVCSTHDGKQDTACIINTPVQISSDPLRIAISVNKANYTNECIASCGIFNLSILAEDVDFGLIKHFGFQSGRDVYKYENCDKSKFSKNGLRYTTFGTNGFISCKVVSSQDMGSHTLFIAEVTEAAKLRDVPSVTYDYYHKNIKPQPEAKEKKGYVCNICGYIHEGDELPEDFICPICKHPASDFRPL